MERFPCGMCGTYFDESSLQKAGRTPLCFECYQQAYNRRLPQWLKLSFLALVALLVVSLLHGKKYFHLEREYVRGERLVAQKHYAEAVPHLLTVCKGAPNCEECVLLLAKAQLLTGDFQAGGRTLHAHNDGRFKDSELGNEVNGIVSRIGKALQQINEAEKDEKAQRWDLAAQKARAATKLYPENAPLARVASAYEFVAIFEHKQWDQLLEFAEQKWRSAPDASESVSWMASALACKYAATGTPEFKVRAEEMLSRSRTLLKEPSERDLVLQQDFEDRMRYRLVTRQIIEAKEYYKRTGKTPPKEEQ